MLTRTVSEKDARHEEDVGINPKTRNKGLLLAYHVIKELEGYNLSNIIRKKSADLDQERERRQISLNKNAK